MELQDSVLNPESLKNYNLYSLLQNRITPLANSLSLFIVVRELFYQFSLPSDLLRIISLLIHSFEYQVTLCCGDGFSLFLTNDGEIYGWGNNDKGQLGNGKKTDIFFQSLPTKVRLNTQEISTITCGSHVTYAILKNGDVYSWGGLEQYHDYYKKIELLPRKISELEKIIMISSNKLHNLAINFDGEIFYWKNGNISERYGYSISSQNNNNNFSLRKISPMKVQFIDPEDESEETIIQCTSVSCGGDHLMAISREGNLYSWGNNSYGQLGYGTLKNYNGYYPQLVTGRVNSSRSMLGCVVSVSCGSDHTIILTKEGKLFAWGSDKYGQLGIDLKMFVSSDSLRYLTSPQQITKIGFPSSIQIIMIACGANHSLALSKEGHVYSWGYNHHGQLGLGKKNDEGEIGLDKANYYTYYERHHQNYWDKEMILPICVYSPQKIEGLENISIISCGSNFSSAITTDGIVYVWGRVLVDSAHRTVSSPWSKHTSPVIKVMSNMDY